MFEPSLFQPGVYFNITCIGKLPGPTNEFERSLVFETGEFERQSLTVYTKNAKNIFRCSNMLMIKARIRLIISSNILV